MDMINKTQTMLTFDIKLFLEESVSEQFPPSKVLERENFPIHITKEFTWYLNEFDIFKNLKCFTSQIYTEDIKTGFYMFKMHLSWDNFIEQPNDYSTESVNELRNLTFENGNKCKDLIIDLFLKHKRKLIEGTKDMTVTVYDDDSECNVRLSVALKDIECTGEKTSVLNIIKSYHK